MESLTEPWSTIFHKVEHNIPPTAKERELLTSMLDYINKAHQPLTESAPDSKTIA